MRNSYKAISIVILMLFAGYSNSFAGSEDIVDDLLDTLDVALTQRQAVIDKRMAEANALVQSADNLPMSLEKAQGYCHASEAFMHLSSDSAIKYALKEYDVVNIIKNDRQLIFCRLDLLKAYTRRGDMGKAYEVISDIGDITTILPEAREKYAIALLDFYLKLQTNNDAYSGPSQTARSAWNYYSHFITKGSVAYYFYQSTCGGKLDLDKALKLLNNVECPSFGYADLSVAIAREYNRRGNEDEYYNYLVTAAICDAKMGNTEVSSLLFLLQTPLLENDIKRSYEYSKVLVDNVTTYHDMNRALKVVEIQSNINKKFSEDRKIIILVASIAVFLLLVALVFFMIQTRLLKTQRTKIIRKLKR